MLSSKALTGTSKSVSVREVIFFLSVDFQGKQLKIHCFPMFLETEWHNLSCHKMVISRIDALDYFWSLPHLWSTILPNKSFISPFSQWDWKLWKWLGWGSWMHMSSVILLFLSSPNPPGPSINSAVPRQLVWWFRSQSAISRPLFNISFWSITFTLTPRSQSYSLF